MAPQIAPHVLPSGDVLSPVHSFPLLDDLLLTGIPLTSDAKVTTPSTSPTFSGGLCLVMFREMGVVVFLTIGTLGGSTLPW